MIYFVSDVHLGLCSSQFNPKDKESEFVNWLKNLKDCTELYLLGDIFDFWYEYKHVVPKGFIRLLGQLAKMSDEGIKIRFISGNHDLWLRDYFDKELNIESSDREQIVSLNGKRVLLTHGDAIGGQTSFLGKIFRSGFLRWFFERLVHPDLVMSLGHKWSYHNRMSRSISHEFRGEDEPIVRFSRKFLANNPDIDYIVCGHIHNPVTYKLSERTTLIVLGQWVIGAPVVAGMDEKGNISLIDVVVHGGRG